MTTQIGLSDGSQLYVERPVGEVRKEISRLAADNGESAGAPRDFGDWLDAGAGIQVNPAHVVYVKQAEREP